MPVVTGDSLNARKKKFREYDLSCFHPLSAAVLSNYLFLVFAKGPEPINRYQGSRTISSTFTLQVSYINTCFFNCFMHAFNSNKLEKRARLLFFIR